MLDIKNKTPFQVAVIPGLDKDGHEYATVVIKGTFDIKKDQTPLPISENQVPICFGDEFYGEPGKSSIKYESDTCLRKKGTDVVLIGHAYSKRGLTKLIDVNLQIGSLNKTVYVFGDRKWYRSMGSWKYSDPLPFESMPLIYEKAFGGEDIFDPDPGKQDHEKRNPVGIGFVISGKSDKIENTYLPNIEDPVTLIKSWKDKPTPAGFGFIGRDWQPRVNYAGTYDEKWEKERCPLLPDDFNELYFNAAQSDLIAKQYLIGGDFVKISNASKDGDLIFKLPLCRFDVDLNIQAKEGKYNPVMDTVIIEPGENRIMLIWRVAIPCFRKFLFIEAIRIKQTAEI